jgi:beta-galactosidase/beta-glucuronidase
MTARPPSRRYVSRLATVLLALVILLVPGAVSAGADEGPPAADQGPSGRVALRGPWVIAPDPHIRGTRRNWQAGNFTGRTVSIPHAFNAVPILGAAGSRNYRGSVAWYRTTFTTAKPGVYALRYESISHRAAVWLNGQRLGHHVGAYLPFESRLDLPAGTHTLVIRADWRSPAAMKREGWHRTWFNFGGVNREITLRPIASSEVIAPSLQTRLVTSGGVRSAVVDLAMQVRNNGLEREIAPSGVLVHAGREIKLSFPARVMPAGGSGNFKTQITVENPALWAPGSPNLYEMRLEVGDETHYYARVGLRELRWRRGLLYLNGRRIRLRGASIHEDARGRGDALTPHDQNVIVRQLKRLGANATRSQHQLDQGLLERLDAAGIMVWMGVGPVDSPGNWTSKTIAQRRAARKRVRISVRQTRLHPSIIAWNLVNEVAGNGHPHGQVGYVEDTARYLRRIDPGRLVALDVWGVHAPKRMGRIYRYVHAIGATNYIGWYEDTYADAATLRRRIRSRVGTLHKTFRNKVLMISEFGAEANGRNPTHRPGGYRFQARFLRIHIQTYRRLSYLSGALVWNLRDFAVAPSFAGGSINRLVPGIQLVHGINQKGLITYQHRLKPGFYAAKRAFAGR